MDQKRDILEISLLDQVPHFIKSNEKKKVARRRWAILAKALKSPTASQPSSPTDEISVRRISSFMLLSTRELPLPPISTPLTSKRTWFEYSLHIQGTTFTLNVGHRNRTFSAEDLMGFNNTGNVCIWPSEETLSHFVCENLSLFEGKSVLELGGGMSCLAGLFAAKYGGTIEVVVTDGNKTSIDNVEAIIECNSFPSSTHAAILQWNQHHQKTQFDCILSADCLFFDDARVDFIDCLKSHLKSDGHALVMAPERGETLDSFILQSEARGLCCRKVVNYSPVVWEKRLELMDNADFDDNIHYPILIESRDFHENGRRHKENVKKRLKNIGKASAKTARETEKIDYTIKSMEAAALEAYRKDVEANESADLTSININKKLKKDNLAIASGSGYKVWREAVSGAGKTYYFNTFTNETIWTPPPEGYLSLKGQRDERDQQTLKQMKEVAKFKRQEAMVRTHEVMQDEAEESARRAREELKKRRVKEDTPPPVYGPLLDDEPLITPYGRWQTVEPVVEKQVDLQLPKQEFFECPVVVEPEPIVKEFKEKTLEKLDEEGEGSFKKRKIVMGAKRNTRRRLDDD